MIKCITCDRFTLRGASLAKHGFGLCKLRPKWENYPAQRDHECWHHQQASEAKVAARIEWLAKQGGATKTKGQ